MKNSEQLSVVILENYRIEANGRIFSCLTNRYLSPGLNSRGYQSVKLIEYGGGKYITVHRLIATLFIPNKSNKPCINHKNGIKTDNRVENLEWCTYGENMQHSYNTLIRRRIRHSEETKIKMSIKRRRLPPYNVKPVFSTDSNGDVAQYNSLADASRKLGVTPPMIIYYIKNESKKDGLMWNYR